MNNRPRGPINGGDYQTRPDKQAYKHNAPLIVDPLSQKSQSQKAKKMARLILIATILIFLMFVIIYLAGS